MDIRTWLDGTVRPEPLPSPDPLRQPGPPRFHPPKEPEGHAAGAGARRARRRPRQSSEDSSLLAAPTVRSETPPSETEADIDGSGDDTACSDAYHPAHHAPPESSTSSQQYARRPRRKTRPELYEPTPKDAKERGTQLYRHRKGESNRSKRKSRRRKADKPGVGLVQSFHAKNVSKDRLTLRPREKLGLFNKGRASSPVKGRGLPDLVFSEMKFLKKHRAQPDVSVQAGSSLKKRKKDSAHAKTEEISAYFTSVRPPLAEKDVNIQAKEDTRRKLLPLNTKHKRERSSLIASALPTIELPDKGSHVSVGSRRRRHKGSDGYISWSESIWAPSATPVPDRTGSLINVGQLDWTQGREQSTNTNGGDVLHSHATSRPVTRHLTDNSGDVFYVSSLTPARQPVSQSHSFPRRASSPRRAVHNGRTERHQTIGAVAYPSSIPPAIPVRPDARHRPRRTADRESATDLSGLSRSPIESGLARRRTTEGLGMPNDNSVVDLDPPSSSSLGKLLHECNSAFDKQRRQTATLRDHGEVPHTQPRMTNNMSRLGNTESSGTKRRLSTVRFVGDDTDRPLVQNYSRPSIYEEQARREHPLQPHFLEDQSVSQYNCNMLEEDGENEYYSGQGYGNLGWESMGQGTAPIGFGVGPVEEIVTPSDVEDGGLRYNQRNNVVARGFWRPHKLY